MDEQATKLIHQAMPFAQRLGIEVLEHSKDLVRTRLAWQHSLTTLGESMHGGALMSLADATGAALAYSNIPQGAQGTTTIESRTSFLRPIGSGHATASARPLHVGRRVIVVETEIQTDTGRLAAKVTQTQAII